MASKHNKHLEAHAGISSLAGGDTAAGAAQARREAGTEVFTPQ